MEIRVPKQEEKKKVVKFLNKVFHRPFPSLIPSLYGKNKNTMEHHFIVEENGKLVGGICAYPQEIKVGDIGISGVGVGMVATLKSMRGKGVMSSMLRRVFSEYENKAEVSYLTGRRDRYQHFGYYPAGEDYAYKISDSSIKKFVNGCPYTIELAKTDDDLNMVDTIAESAELVVKKPGATESDVLKNWFSKLYVIKENGSVVGFVSGKFRTIERIFIKDASEQDYINGVYAYKNFKGISSLEVEVMPMEKTLKQAMHSASEDYFVKSTAKYKVFSYKRLIEKLLLIGSQNDRLEDYEKIIEIKGRERLKISISNGAITVDESEEEPNVILTEEQAIASLLGIEESLVKGIGKISIRHSDFI